MSAIDDPDHKATGPLIVTRELMKVYRMEGYAVTALNKVSQKPICSSLVAPLA